MAKGFLYILDNGNGLVKIGIATAENLNNRIKEIQTAYSNDTDFKLITSIPINSNLAFVEKIMHEMLHAQNLKFLTKKINLIELLPLVESNKTGHTEIFISNKKNIIGILLLLKLSRNLDIEKKDFEKLEAISEYSLDIIPTTNKSLDSRKINDMKLFFSEKKFINKAASLDEVSGEVVIKYDDKNSINIMDFINNYDADFKDKLINLKIKDKTAVSYKNLIKIAESLMKKNNTLSLPKITYNKELKIKQLEEQLKNSDNLMSLMGRLNYIATESCVLYSFQELSKMMKKSDVVEFWDSSQVANWLIENIVLGDNPLQKVYSLLEKNKKTRYYNETFLDGTNSILKELLNNRNNMQEIVHNYLDLEKLLIAFSNTNEKIAEKYDISDNYYLRTGGWYNDFINYKIDLAKERVDELVSLIFNNENYNKFCLSYYAGWFDEDENILLKGLKNINYENLISSHKNKRNIKY